MFADPASLTSPDTFYPLGSQAVFTGGPCRALPHRLGRVCAINRRCETLLDPASGHIRGDSQQQFASGHIRGDFTTAIRIRGLRPVAASWGPRSLCPSIQIQPGPVWLAQSFIVALGSFTGRWRGSSAPFCRARVSRHSLVATGASAGLLSRSSLNSAASSHWARRRCVPNLRASKVPSVSPRLGWSNNPRPEVVNDSGAALNLSPYPLSQPCEPGSVSALRDVARAHKAYGARWTR